MIFKKFRNVLKPNRYLVLGMDETLWGHKLQNSFSSLNSKDRIYQKNLSVDSESSLNFNKSNRTSIERLSNFIGGKK